LYGARAEIISSDKTIDHMILCPNWLMKKKIEKIIKDLCKKGIRRKIPRQIINALCVILTKYFEGKLITQWISTPHPSTRAHIYSLYVPWISGEGLEGGTTNQQIHPPRRADVIPTENDVGGYHRTSPENLE